MSRYIIAFVLLSGRLLAQNVTYSVNIHDIRSHRVDVTVDIQQNPKKVLTYQMPAWAPGAYALTNYGRFVEDFRAVDAKGKPLSVTRLNENRWVVKNAGPIIKLTYRVRDSHKDSTSLYFGMAHFDTNIFFANATALFGYVNDNKDRPTGVQYYVPLPWTLHTALDGYMNDAVKNNTVQYVFTAKNYDELADAPVLASPNIQLRKYEIRNKPIVIALVSDKEFQMDSLEVLTRDILKAQIDFWGDFPCPRYYFLIYAPTFLRLPSLAQGALEHSNSSAYLLVNMPWNKVKSSFAHILSHEVFHLWNVKRIHSSLLGPFDYTKPVKTTSLWLSEGITDYYGHLLLSRYGILDESEFERQIVGWNYSMNHSKNSAAYSLEELSKMQSDFRLENATVFYFKGPLVGLLLDLEIRERTNNQRSLDDVMYALYKDAKIGNHFRDNDLFPTMERIAGVKMPDFYRKYIAGKDSLPVDEYLAKIGLIRNFRDTLRSGVSLGAKVYYSSIGRCIIDSVTDPELQNAGVMKGDTILTINNETVNREYINKILAKKMTPPISAEVLIGTLSGRRTLKHTFTRSAETTISTKDIGRMPTADHRQIKLRQSLYGKRNVN